MKKIMAKENEEYNVRDFHDRRKKVDRYTISYQDEIGQEYRKSFCFPVGTSQKEVNKNIPVQI